MLIKKIKIKEPAMKFIVYFLPLFFACSSAIGMQNSAASLDWKTEQDFHITLFSLPGDYSQQLFIKKNNEALKAIKAKNIAFPLTFPLQTADILTPTKIFNGYVLNTSSENPKGDHAKFNELLKTNPPSSEKGKHWYLVLNIGSYNDLDLNSFKTFYTNAYFTTPSRSNFLPHITIAEITEISDAKIFLASIKKVNKLLKKQPAVLTKITEKNIIFKPATPEHSRSNVMLEIATKNIVNRIKIIKAWLIQSIHFQQKEKKLVCTLSATPQPQATMLQNTLIELTQKLQALDIQLQF